MGAWRSYHPEPFVLRTRIAMTQWARLLALVALTGHPQVTAYFQSNLTDAAYQKRAFDRVAKLFKPKAHPPKVGGKAVVQAVIAADGKLQSAMVSMQSGSSAWDDAAARAVQRAAPFAPLPKGFSAPQVEAHFHFAWAP